jgi:hypothetical protein
LFPPLQALRASTAARPRTGTRERMRRRLGSPDEKKVSARAI